MEWLKILVILYMVFVLKCSAMSRSEIEDFANYLQMTSRLDETLKKGTNVEDDDVEDKPSDHAWEESGKFEGDLILNERQRRLIVEDVAEGLSRNGLRDSSKKWPNNEVIYYIQREHFSSDQVQAIEDGIDDIVRSSCVKFRPYRKGDRDAVVIQGSRRGCFSQVGYQGGYQVLNLNARHPSGRGCFRHGTVVHELLHTLGFYHMQSSPDRDDYVDVIWENIAQQARNNFRKYNTFSVSDFGVGYDYDSVLHYSRRAFSINGQDTLVPKQRGAEIGQRIGLSDKDTQKLNKMYCDANSNDADEESTQKTVTKKKNPKNKPFDGHGIAYHQGKIVAIKLLPSPATIQLPDTTFHMFDYFSKTPKAVSPKIGSSGEHLKDPFESFALNIKNDKTTYKPFEQDVENSNSYTPPNIDDRDHDKKTEINENTSTSVENNDESSEIGNDFENAFDRLGKIIKTHVYPSYTPNFNAYKANTDYSEFQPDEYRKSDNSKILFNTYDIPEEKSYVEKSPVPFNENSSNSPSDIENSEGRRPNSHTTESDAYDPSSGEDLTSMKSFRTSAPYYKPDENIKAPQYVNPANLLDRNNYSSLYQRNNENENDEDYLSKKYKIFGDPVPLYNDWYNIKEQDKINDYTTPIYNSDLNNKQNYRLYSSPSEKNYSFNGEQPYNKRYNEPAPFTKSSYNNR